MSGSEELCHYDDSQRTDCLKRLRKLAASERCYHVRHTPFVEVGVETLLLFDAFCGFEGQSCSKSPCADDLRIFARCDPFQPYPQELTVTLTLSSTDPQFLKFRTPDRQQAQSEIKIERAIRPPLNGKDRGKWPRALSAYAVCYPSSMENHIPVRLEVSVANGQTILGRLKHETWFRIPRTNECIDHAPNLFSQISQTQSANIKQVREVDMNGAELIVLQETFKLLLKEGYESVKKFLAHAHEDSEAGTRSQTNSLDPQVPPLPQIDALIKSRLNEGDQQVLFAMSESYLELSKSIALCITEKPKVDRGLPLIRLEEEIDRLKREQTKVGEQINSVLTQKAWKAAP